MPNAVSVATAKLIRVIATGLGMTFKPAVAVNDCWSPTLPRSAKTTTHPVAAPRARIRIPGRSVHESQHQRKGDQRVSAGDGDAQVQTLHCGLLTSRRRPPRYQPSARSGAGQLEFRIMVDLRDRPSGLAPVSCRRQPMGCLRPTEEVTLSFQLPACWAYHRTGREGGGRRLRDRRQRHGQASFIRLVGSPPAFEEDRHHSADCRPDRAHRRLRKRRRADRSRAGPDGSHTPILCRRKKCSEACS
ncbi:hypothetical protein SAMN05216337_10764 [Bradyrhizobium brasilense]|uniref:Uncharacterized protein n=1 Tax=Bradyrhizobium brasilense TaxID=1419277 RepID=A0A1G7P624_9BRAD|nr:hypothetical protein SAMN05216337_10764 [Bradyrhizobium brasilense]